MPNHFVLEVQFFDRVCVTCMSVGEDEIGKHCSCVGLLAFVGRFVFGLFLSFGEGFVCTVVVSLGSDAPSFFEICF